MIKQFVENIKRPEAKEYIKTATKETIIGQFKWAAIWSLVGVTMWTFIAGVVSDKDLLVEATKKG